MMRCVKRLAALVCGATVCSSLALAMAQPYIFTNQGQSPQQEQFNKGQCYSRAVLQTGFDPSNPQVAMAPPPMQQAPQGGMFRGAAGGAALGAAGGVITPIINQPSLLEGGGRAFRLRDINHTFFLSPAKPGEIIWVWDRHSRFRQQLTRCWAVASGVWGPQPWG
jgi:hypothetical protein